MKNYYVFLLAFFIAFTLSCQTTKSTENSIDIEKEKEAVIAVIEKEKDAFLNKNIAEIESTWLHDASVRKFYYNAGSVFNISGWTEVYLHDSQNVANLPAEVTSIGTFSDFSINIYGNTALVYCKLEWSKAGRVWSIQHRILHLVKVDGEWKFDLMAMN